MFRSIAFMTLFGLMHCASMAKPPTPLWPASHPVHRAAFCGHDGQPALTNEYALALLDEVKRLERSGLAGPGLWDQLRRQASCEREALRVSRSDGAPHGGPDAGGPTPQRAAPRMPP